MTNYSIKKKNPSSLDDDFEYVMTKDGEPVAVIVGIDRFRSMTETLGIMSNKDFMSSLNHAKEEVRKGKKLLSRKEVFGDF